MNYLKKCMKLAPLQSSLKKMKSRRGQPTTQQINQTKLNFFSFDWIDCWLWLRGLTRSSNSLFFHLFSFNAKKTNWEEKIEFVGSVRPAPLQ